MWKWAIIILLVIVVLWLMSYHGVNLTLGFGKSEYMVDEAAWLEVPRGFNMSNAGPDYRPIMLLSDIEDAGHIDQVRLDSSVVI